MPLFQGAIGLRDRCGVSQPRAQAPISVDERQFEPKIVIRSALIVSDSGADTRDGVCALNRLNRVRVVDSYLFFRPSV
jgi:hypothetical protein